MSFAISGSGKDINWEAKHVGKRDLIHFTVLVEMSDFKEACCEVRVGFHAKPAKKAKRAKSKISSPLRALPPLLTVIARNEAMRETRINHKNYPGQ